MSKKLNKVKEYREEKTWSITELAQKAGLSFVTISKMEKGVKTSRLSELKVAKALEQSHEDVFDDQ